MKVTGLRWKLAQTIERLWWKSYLRKKDIDTYLEWKRNYWQGFYQPIAELLNISSTTNILDAGCGPAGIFTIFPNNNVVAIDPLLDAYEKDLPHFSTAMYPNVQFVTQTIEAFRKENYFDAIFCINAINHVKNMQLGIDNLVSSAKVGAKIVISIDAHNYQLFQLVMKLIPGDVLHPHQFNLKEYQTMIEQAGTKILSTTCLKKEFIFSYFRIVAEKVALK